MPRVSHDIRNIKGSVSDPMMASLEQNSFSLYVTSNNLYMSFYIRELNGEGNYELLQSLLGYPGTGGDTLNNRCVLEYYGEFTDPYRSFGPPASGEINITKLSDNRNLIEGTFKVTLYKQNETGDGLILNDSIKITDGKFNLNINTLNQK